MNKFLWILSSFGLGALFGAISYAWDALDGKVDMLGGVIHDKALIYGLLILAVEVLGWAFEYVPGIFVLGGILGLIGHIFIAFVLNLAWPLLKAVMPKPAVP